jgi:Cu2+-exporting ATPase
MMRTATLEVGGLFAELDHLGVEKQLSKGPGVKTATVNPASGSATVDYDDTVTDVESLRRAIEDCGFHCRGERVPRHVCALNVTAVSPSHPRAPSAHVGHERRPRPGAAQAKAASAATHDMMAHEMGHGAGMDMLEMVRDMRNRFLISLIFTIPIFAMAPMGMGEPWIRPPFGLSENVAMFLFASAAILYPVWPFVVAAWRASRNGILNMAVLVVLERRHGVPVQRRQHLFCGKASSFTRRHPSSSCSFSSAIGWKCGPERALPPRSALCSISPHPKRS